MNGRTPHSRTRNSVLNLVTGIGGQLFITLLQFVTRTVFIYTLGKMYLGINGLFTDILNVLSLTELGIGTAMNYRFYKPLAERDEKRVRVLLKFYKLAYRLIGTVIFVLGLAMIPALRFLIKDYDSLAALGINATLVFVLNLLSSASSYLFFAYRSAVVHADQRSYILELSHVAVHVLMNAAQIVLLLLLHNYILYILVAVVFNILNNLVNAVIAQRLYPRFFIHEEESLSREEIAGLLKDCWALFFYNVNVVVLDATDNLTLSTLMGLTAVGLYSNYLVINRTIMLILSKFFDAIQASMGNLYATADVEKNHGIFKAVNLVAAVLYGTADVGIAVTANEVIVCWIGEEYLLPQPLSLLIGLVVFVNGMVICLVQARVFSGVFRQLWFRPLLTILVNLVVSVSMTLACGIHGVVVGTIAAYTLTNIAIEPHMIYKYTFQGKKSVLGYYGRLLEYFATLAAVGIADWFICSRFFVGHGILSLLVHIVICGVSVPLTFFLLYRKTEEGKLLLHKLEGITAVVLKKK